MVRIWHQSVNELEHLGVYREALEAHAAEVLGSEAEVVVHGMPTGTYGGVSPTALLGNAYAYHRVLGRIVDNAVAAEREGYDAFVIGSFSEPYLREMRAAVDVPVASLTEAGILVGCSLGRYVGLVSNAPAVQWMTRTAVDKHGLGARVLDVVSLDPALDEPALAEAYRDPAPVVANFTAAAERLVARGADVIIPAEGVLAELLCRHGLREVGGASVMDVFGVAWAYALMQARLFRTTGLRVGRAWHHRRDDPALVQRLSETTP